MELVSGPLVGGSVDVLELLRVFSEIEQHERLWFLRKVPVLPRIEDLEVCPVSPVVLVAIAATAAHCSVIWTTPTAPTSVNAEACEGIV